MKKVLVLLIMMISLNSCGEGCGDCCLGDPCWDAKIGGVGGGFDLDMDYDPYVVLSEICDLNLNMVDTIVYMSCEGFDDLMVDNTPPNECDEITIIDKDGNSFTGLYRTSVSNTTKCGN